MYGHPDKSGQKRANGGAGQLANPYREVASGQLSRTALAEWLETEVREGGRNCAQAEWLETEVHEGGRNDALARGVGLMGAAGTPRPAAEAAAMVVSASVPPAASWPGGRQDV